MLGHRAHRGVLGVHAQPVATRGHHEHPRRHSPVPPFPGPRAGRLAHLAAVLPPLHLWVAAVHHTGPPPASVRLDDDALLEQATSGGVATKVTGSSMPGRCDIAPERGDASQRQAAERHPHRAVARVSPTPPRALRRPLSGRGARYDDGRRVVHGTGWILPVPCRNDKKPPAAGRGGAGCSGGTSILVEIRARAGRTSRCAPE